MLRRLALALLACSALYAQNTAGTGPASIPSIVTHCDVTTPTKCIQFALAGITSSTTRTITFPDLSGTVTLLGNTTNGSGNIVLATSPGITTPTITGNVTHNGLVSTYNSIALVDGGQPYEVAHIDLTGQVAAISTGTALYTPTATGRFRISYYAKVTTISSGGTSNLGGTVGFQLAYTDGTDSVAVTLTLPAESQAGNAITIGTGNTTNTTGTISQGSTIVYAKTGVAMTYGFGYATTVGTMAYELRVTVEAL